MVKIHQFKSRPEGFCVNSWILETQTSLILVDSQFLVSEVEGLLKLIRKLAKPLEALLITHPHPDHFNGAGLISREFPRVRIISTAQTAARIEVIDAPKRDYWTPIYKTDYPSFTKFPTERLESGNSATIAGVEFILEDFGAGECETLSVIWLPAERILFPGDLIYDRVHPWLAEGRSTAWLAQITLALARFRNAVRVFPGHGNETSLAGFNEIAEYIKRFQELIRTTPADAEVVRQMKTEYPGMPLEMLLDPNVSAVRKELSAAS